MLNAALKWQSRNDRSLLECRELLSAVLCRNSTERFAYVYCPVFLSVNPFLYFLFKMDENVDRYIGSLF